MKSNGSFFIVKSPARRALTIVLAVALLTVSTAVLFHVHSNQSPAGESHCAMCMALHGVAHAVAAPVVALHFPETLDFLDVRNDSALLPFTQPLAIHDRAPPQV
jgi:hypothetical protein